ncbi:MAG: hypothetical protein RL547_516, partial [Actinomycetota bacterium]
SLLLTTGNLSRTTVSKAIEADEVQHLIHPSGVAASQSEGDVACDVEVWEKSTFLRHDAHAPSIGTFVNRR